MIVRADIISQQGNVVHGGVVLLQDHQVAFGQTATEDSVELRMAEVTLVVDCRLLYFLEGGFYYGFHDLLFVMLLVSIYLLTY